jgi:hypothetical protein
MNQPSTGKQVASPRSRLDRLHDRVVTLCVVEITAADPKRDAFVEDRALSGSLAHTHKTPSARVIPVLEATARLDHVSERGSKRHIVSSIN